MKLVVWVVALGLALQPSSSDACSCASPRVFGLPADHASLDTHVRLWVPPGHATSSFALHEADEPGQQSALERRDSRAASYTVVELIPKQPLRAHTEYVVRDDTGTVVHRFTTGDATDRAPPTWAGVERVKFVEERVRCCRCQTGVPYAAFTMTAPRDDTTRASSIVLAIWQADAKGRIDYAQPPTTIWPYHAEFYLGAPFTCGGANFVFPRKVTSLKLGVKAIDLAGRATAPVEVRLPIAKPLRIER